MVLLEPQRHGKCANLRKARWLDGARQAKSPGSRKQLLDCDTQLHPADVQTWAVVRTATEGEVLCNVRAAQSEPVAFGKHRLIPVRRCIDQRDRLARRYRPPAHFDIGSRCPCKAAIGRVEPQEFLDRIRQNGYGYGEVAIPNAANLVVLLPPGPFGDQLVIGNAGTIERIQPRKEEILRLMVPTINRYLRPAQIYSPR
jgi:hypothetical protein